MQIQHGEKGNPDARDDYECYKHFNTRIAGRYYYRHAEAIAGDDVFFVREPDNPKDRNAIAIHNLAGERIGYLSSELAADYAAMIDLGYSRLKGSLLHCCDPDFDHAEEVRNPTVEVSVESRYSRPDNRLANRATGWLTNSPRVRECY